MSAKLESIPSAESAGAPTGQSVGESKDQATWSDQHIVDLRATLPWFGHRFYFTIVAGHERRSNDRLRRERERHPLATRANILALVFMGTVTGLSLYAVLQVISMMVLQDAGVVSFPEN